MLRSTRLLGCAVTAAGWALLASPQPAAQPEAVLYEGARLVIGDGPVIERGAFVVRDGRIAGLGPMGSVTAPAGARRVDLTGRTVLPVLVNAHLHIGYEGYTSWSAENYTPENVLDHLTREAYYGVGAVFSAGGDPIDAALGFQQDQRAGRLSPAARFLFAAGMAPPGGGPDRILIQGTSALHAVFEVSTAEEARAAVRTVAARGVRFIKIWVDDRRGTYPKMPPPVYRALLDEAHRHDLFVWAHATTLADQKAVLRAGADGVVHMPYDVPADEEYLALVGERRPYMAPIIGFFDRSPVCAGDAFFTEILSEAATAAIRDERCQPPPAGRGGGRGTLQRMITENFPRVLAAGARVVLGTDAGVVNGYSFGWAEHHELERYVELGMSPAQAIEVATARPAAVLGLDGLGTLAEGQDASFLVLAANPLEDIRNLRRIAGVYLRGTPLDRDAIRARLAPGR